MAMPQVAYAGNSLSTCHCCGRFLEDSNLRQTGTDLRSDHARRGNLSDARAGANGLSRFLCHEAGQDDQPCHEHRHAAPGNGHHRPRDVDQHDRDRSAGMACRQHGADIVRLLFSRLRQQAEPVGSIIALITAYALDGPEQGSNRRVGHARAALGVAFRRYPRQHVYYRQFAVRSAATAPRRIRARAPSGRWRLPCCEGPDPHEREAFAEALSEGTGEMPAWLRLAGAEKTSPAEDVARASSGLGVHVPILLLVGMIDRAPKTLPAALKQADRRRA